LLKGGPDQPEALNNLAMLTLKRSIGYLLDAYLTAKGIRFYGRGGFTLKQPGRAAG